MALSRVSSRTMVKIAVALAAIIVAEILLTWIHHRGQAYEGIVVRIDCRPILAGRVSRVYHFALVRTPDGDLLEVDVTYCGRVTPGDYLVKRKGGYCPAVVRRARSAVPRAPLPEVPMPRHPAEATRRLPDYPGPPE